MELRAESVTEESGQTDCQHFVHPALCGFVQSGGTLVDALARANN